MEDIRKYSKRELYLIVANDEHWYCQRTNLTLLKYNLSSCFKYSKRQMEYLEKNLKNL